MAVALLFFIQGSGHFFRLKHSQWQGVAILAAMGALGMLLVWLKDIRHDPHWVGYAGDQDQTLLVSLKEPLIRKQRSYKAEASLEYRTSGSQKQVVRGSIIIYFKKDSLNARLKAGDRLLFRKKLQEIRNAGNPGGFDYKRYALFNGITHQVYLTAADYKQLSGNDLPAYKRILLRIQRYVLAAIQANISRQKEQGLAEAMLIGYKDDLDKNLLQSYTNTGVVHVIAVSGMHLTYLYFIINLLLRPLLAQKKTRWLHAFLVLLILWTFALLAGAQASIVRAAVMFTFITLGKQISRNASIYNILGAAAFCQLCYNPFSLWDVGFQLSYAAVLSIVVFYKPIYDLLFIKNAMLNEVWKLTAVSIAAQIITTPLCIYYFHQFPVYFLLNNLVVVPASTAVLVGTLILVLLSPLKACAAVWGDILEAVIWWLNSFIESVERFPMALWAGISVNVVQVILLFIIMAGLAAWLMRKLHAGLWMAGASLVLFLLFRSYSFFEAAHQQKLVIYNAGRSTAIDFIAGRRVQFFGDESLLQDPSLYNFILAPSRVMHRVSPARRLAGVIKKKHFIQFYKKKIVWVDTAFVAVPQERPVQADLIILSGNPRIYISNLAKHILPGIIVIDASVPAWKANYWKKDCADLKIPCHDVATQGAFVMSLH